MAEGCQKTAWQVHSFCEWGIRGDRPGTGGQFAAVMEARRQAERGQEFKPLGRGWCVGSEEFRAEMLQHLEEQRGEWHYGAELAESGAAQAERLIAEALRTEGMTEEQIAGWRKGHRFKVRLAATFKHLLTPSPCLDKHTAKF